MGGSDENVVVTTPEAVETDDVRVAVAVRVTVVE